MCIESLLKPGKIGKLEMKNRIYMSPMATNFETSDGSVTKELINYYEERAKGGVGLILTGCVHAEMEIARSSITGINTRIDHHKYIIGLSELTDTVHMYGTKIFVQISIGHGSFSSPDLLPPGVQPIAPSPTESTFFPGWTPRVLTMDEIEKIVDAYGKAALRAKLSGFDGIDIHGHSGYLLAQFMSPFTNKRKDKYGDPVALPLALIKAIKENVGDEYPISFRWNIDEFLEGGRNLEESKIDAKIFEKAGIHAINMSGGNFWVPGGAVHSCPPMSYPQGYLGSLAKAMKETVNIPVLLSSKIGDPFVAAKILQEGQADFIGMARGLLADPEWPNKVAAGRIDEIRPCIRDMDGCLNRLVNFKKIRCSVNARCGREGDYREKLAQHPKKVIVVGGGPGGMEAARVAALRGHQVTLYEKSERLGGQVRLAGMIPFKGDVNGLIEYQSKQLVKLGVDIKLGQEVTPESLIAAQPDVVIAAIGSQPIVPKIPGIDKPIVFLARDVVAETVEPVGEKIVVAGGGFVGCDTALFLAVKKRKKVTIIEQFTFEQVGFEPYNMNQMDLMKILEQNKVRMMTETKIEEIINKGVIAVDKAGQRHKIEVDAVVLAVGAVSERGLLEALRGKIANIYAVGDCDLPGKVIDAIHKGFHIAFGL
jgi:2,4-dienoyl-CoA reductase-like NADH-dependent reductase (Old Yellow Enzyme family)/thioredoxin reductase